MTPEQTNVLMQIRLQALEHATRIAGPKADPSLLTAYAAEIEIYILNGSYSGRNFDEVNKAREDFVSNVLVSASCGHGHAHCNGSEETCSCS